MRDGLAFTIQIGDERVPAWLPLLPTRFALEAAYRRSLGWRDDDDAVASGDSSEADFAAVLTAFVAVCWGGEPLELTRHTADGPELVVVPPSPAAIRAFRRDLIELGESAVDALTARGFKPREIFDAGRLVRDAVIASIPRQADVEAAAGNSEAPAGASTEPTSSSE